MELMNDTGFMNEDPKTMQLKADLWLMVREIFEEQKIFPWKGQIYIYPDCRMTVSDETKERILSMVLEISTIFLTKEAYVIHHSFWVHETWWQHFKDTYFPKWLLKRFPPKMRELKYVSHYHRICPHMDIPAEHNRDKHVHLSWLNSPLKGT